MLHNGAPGLGPLKNGDALLVGGHDLGIAVVDGGGADDVVAAVDILSVMADTDLNAQTAQVLHCLAFAHVAAVYRDAGAVQYLGQGRHGNAADADEMRPLPGDHILTDIFHKNLHIMNGRRNFLPIVANFCELIIILKETECNP